MGGNAFPTLSVPRLSHAQYNHLLEICTTILQDRFYATVTSAREGPSKVDHGDIDLLVCTPTHDFKAPDLSTALGATAHTKAGITTSFAIPIPSSDDEVREGTPQYANRDGEVKPMPPQHPQQHAQVDIHVCAPSSLAWELVMLGYGDLMQIIGVLNRAIGLTANDKGLNIRIPEIEPYNRKKAMVLLTHDPRAMFEFLGLDAERYFSQGFASDEEVFAWCVQGRFFGPKARDSENESANDRIRYVKRGMFSRCMNEWMPEHASVWEGRKVWTREEVLEEALRWFPKVKEEYEGKMREHEGKVRDEELLKEIKGAVPLEGDRLVGEVMRGLKRFVKYEAGRPVLCDTAVDEEITEKPKWMDHVTDERKEELLDWIRENWEEVRQKEKERTSFMKQKRERLKAEQGS
jgi:hypothetical protein